MRFNLIQNEEYRIKLNLTVSEIFYILPLNIF